VNGELVQALISTGNGWFYVRGSNEAGEQFDGHVVQELDTRAGDMLMAAFESTTRQLFRTGEIRGIGMVIVANKDYQSSLSSAAVATRMRTVVDYAALFYLNDLQLKLDIEDIEVYRSSDPFPLTASNVCGEKIEEMKTLKSSNVDWNVEDTAYLFFGRDLRQLDGTNAEGCAQIGNVCEEWGVGVGEVQTSTITEAKLLAHEYGHLLGADEDGNGCNPSGDMSCPNSRFIMAPQLACIDLINGFEACSENEINNLIALVAGVGSCMQPIQCGSIDHDNEDAITAVDALQALKVAVGLFPVDYIYLLDVTAPFGFVTPTDALVLLYAAVDLMPEPTRCGP
jgi:hypothetical protein